ncbi:MAG TPA: diphthine--ammonia ligase [Flavobacteriaceae bacterium]|nr:diphthine--ammonia ligase [Flavobacteriaceae bacterium]
MSKTFLHWSSGKDSALSLYYLLKKQPVTKLLTTVNAETQHVSMHGISAELLLAQEKSIEIPIQQVYLQPDLSLKSYNAQMEKVYRSLLEKGFDTAAFGDILLEDLKEYRENELDRIGMKYVFPLWGRDTKTVMEDFIELGFKAVVVAVQADKISKDWVGRIIDKDFLKDLPKGVDWSGENGEYHTFVFDGPVFTKPIAYTIHNIVERSFGQNEDADDNCFNNDSQSNWASRFYYADIQLAK